MIDLVWLIQAVGALREARNDAEFVLLAPGVARSLRRVVSADEISFTGLDSPAAHPATAPSVIDVPGDSGRLGWDTSASCDTECFRAARTARPAPGLVMPLPGPHGTVGRLAFARDPDHPFAEEERAAAVLLQPHITDALRVQSHRAAAQRLTTRQHELLRLVASGYDNVEIARQLCLSPATVRKHLENAFARLDVPSRTAAVARLWPDVTWH